MYLGLKMKLKAVFLEASRIAKNDVDKEIAILGITKDIIDSRIAELEKEKNQEKALLVEWAIGEHLK